MPVIRRDKLNQIRDAIEKKYAKLAIMVLGADNVPASYRAQHPNLDGEPILEKVYYHNYLNAEGDEKAPKTLSEMMSQQAQRGILPVGEAHEIAINYVNTNLLELIEKHKAEVTSRLVGIIQDSNNRYKNNALTDLDRPEQIDQMMKESSIQEIKQRLRDYTGDANRNWDRVAVTEVSNAVGAGSADRIVAQNKGEKDANEIYVYRINPNDAATCKYCRSFYIDDDGSPKVYRLSTILNNGSNYGVKADQWKPVSGATHPNCRDSQLLELKPGWKVQSGGSVTWIGLSKWEEYIRNKVVS